jgi:hypothetical protein
MDTCTIACNNCGATLEVPDSVRFITCRACGTQLAIQYSDSAIFTQLDDTTNQLDPQTAIDLASVKNEILIERLDREWALRQETFMMFGRGKSKMKPTVGHAWLTIALGLLGPPLWLLFVATIGKGPRDNDALSLCFGVLCGIGMIVTGIRMLRHAHKFTEEEQKYLRLRAELLAGPETKRITE